MTRRSVAWGSVLAGVALGFVVVASTAAQGRPDIEWMRGGHIGSIAGLAYAPDGTLVSLGSDGTLKVWQPATRLLLRTIRAHDEGSALALTPDGTIAATVGSDLATDTTNLKLWRVSDGALLWAQTRPAGAGSPFGLPAFSPDAEALVVLGSDGPVLLRASDGMALRTLSMPAGYDLATGGAFSFSPDGHWLATSTAQGNALTVFSLVDEVILMYGTNTGGRPAFSPDGMLIAVAGTAGLGTPAGVRVFPLSAACQIWKALSSCDSSAYAYAHGILGWNVKGPDPATLADVTFDVTSVGFSPDGTQLAAAGAAWRSEAWHSTLRVWSTADWSLLHRDDAPEASWRTGDGVIAYSWPPADGAPALAAGFSHVREWDSSDWSPASDATAHANGISAVGFSAVAQSVVSVGGMLGSLDGAPEHIRAWEAATGQPLSTIPMNGGATVSAISRDGTLVAAVEFWKDRTGGKTYNRARLAIWSLPSGTLVRTIATDADAWADYLAFSDDGSLLAARGGSSNDVRLWQTGTPVSSSCLAVVGDGMTFGGDASPGAIGFLPDGCSIVVGGTPYSLPSAAESASLTASGDYVRAFASSPDGRRFALAVWNAFDLLNRIKIFQASDSSSIREISGGYDQPGWVTGLAFAPDGEHLVSGTFDGTVQVWQVSDGTEVARYDEETGVAPSGEPRVTAVAVSPDGARLAFGRYDSTIMVAHSPFAGGTSGDTTPPTVTITGPVGQWQPGPVTITIDASDNPGGSGVASLEYEFRDRHGPYSVSVPGDHVTLYFEAGFAMVSVVAVDHAGNRSDVVSATVYIDSCPPDLSDVILAGLSGANGWFRSAVSIAPVFWDPPCEEGASGVVTSEYSLNAGTPWLPYESTFTVAAEGMTSVWLRATDQAGNAGLYTVPVMIDTVPPGVTMTAPAPRRLYERGQILTADYACADGLSGVATCIGTVAAGLQIDTTTVGTKTFTVTTTDHAGNTRTETVSYSVVDQIIDGRIARTWLQGAWHTLHLAVFPDGTLVGSTGNGQTVPLIDPATGNPTLLPGLFENGAIGVQPNPVVWADRTTGYLIGYLDQTIVYRQDGSLHWKYSNAYGCCNGVGGPHFAVDRPARRLLVSLGDRLYTLPLDTGPPEVPVFGSGGQGYGLVASLADVAYVAGGGGNVTKWSISGPQPTVLWSRAVGDTAVGPPSQTNMAYGWNFSEGAIAADGSFVVSRAGNHITTYWASADFWRAGELFWVAADGQSMWARDAYATTPPVIGRSGLIFVGGLAAAGAPQLQIDGTGAVRAFDQNGNEAWTTLTAGLPQDLFVGDDGNLYVLVGGTTEGRLLALDQATGAVTLVIDHLPSPWEVILRNGVVYVTGDTGVSAVPLPSGFAVNYDPLSPWPVRQHDNQRTSQRAVVAAPTAVTVRAASAPFNGTTDLRAQITSESTPVRGVSLTFSLFGTPVGSATTDASGEAVVSASLAGHDAGLYAGVVEVTFVGDPDYARSSATADVTIVPAVPVITWPAPAEVIDGTVLGPTQLNATANVPGSFAYTPAAGTVLRAGTITLAATFTPQNTLNYQPATAQVVQRVAPPIVVTVSSPNGGERLFAAVPWTIRWAASGGVGGGPVFFDVFVSTDRGVTFNPLASCTRVSGALRSCVWPSPGPATSQARVKIVASDTAGNTGSDVSDADVTISTSAPSITVTVPAPPPAAATVWPVGSTQTIQWSHNLGTNSTVSIDLTIDGGQSWSLVNAGARNSGTGSGSWSWVVPNMPTTNAQIQLTWVEGEGAGYKLRALSVPFTIEAPRITVTSPVKDPVTGLSPVWRRDRVKTIKWTHNLPAGTKMEVSVSRDAGLTWSLPICTVFSSSTKSTGSDSCDWTVTGPGTAPDRARIRVMESKFGTSAVSDPFTIQ